MNEPIQIQVSTFDSTEKNIKLISQLDEPFDFELIGTLPVIRSSVTYTTPRKSIRSWKAAKFPLKQQSPHDPLDGKNKSSETGTASA